MWREVITRENELGVGSPDAAELVGSDDSDEYQTPSEMPTSSVGIRNLGLR